MTRRHGGYTVEDLRSNGITPNNRDIARSLDSGHTGIDSVIAGAPDLESDAEPEGKKRTRQPKQTTEEKQKASDLEEFQRLRPQLTERWKRRLRIPYSLWARLANDPQIALSERELDEGAIMHVDFCEAMGWLKAGKIEAIIDLSLWHGATALSRSDLGKQLLRSFSGDTEQVPVEE